MSNFQSDEYPWKPNFSNYTKLKQKNLQLGPKTFQKILVKNCCVTSFFRRCPANPTFLALQCPISNKMSTHGSQTSENTSNCNKKPLTRFKDFSENLKLNLLCDVIFPSLPGQSDILGLTMSNFQSDEHPWKPNLSNRIKLKQKTSNYNHFHNILRIVDVLPNFPFTISETMGDYYL